MFCSFARMLSQTKISKLADTRHSYYYFWFLLIYERAVAKDLKRKIYGLFGVEMAEPAMMDVEDFFEFISVPLSFRSLKY